MTDYPTVDRVIADLKRLSAGFWHTDREREIGNVMVDARHCLEQLVAEVSALNQKASDKFLDLTDRERVAVMWAVASLETDPEPDAGQNKEAAEILGEMLMRTAAPINRKPQ